MFCLSISRPHAFVFVFPSTGTLPSLCFGFLLYALQFLFIATGPLFSPIPIAPFPLFIFSFSLSRFSLHSGLPQFPLIASAFQIRSSCFNFLTPTLMVRLAGCLNVTLGRRGGGAERNQARRCRACARKGWQGGCLKKCGEDGRGDGFDVCGM